VQLYAQMFRLFWEPTNFIRCQSIILQRSISLKMGNLILNFFRDFGISQFQEKNFFPILREEISILLFERLWRIKYQINSLKLRKISGKNKNLRPDLIS